MNLGETLKKIRKQKNVTLQKLSELTGLSIGYLSNIERDNTSPTLDYLSKICSALNADITEIVAESTKNSSAHIKSTDFKEVFVYANNTGISHSVAGEFFSFRCMKTTFESECFDAETIWGHDTDELGIVTKGILLLEMNGTAYEVEENELILVPANTPHKYSKLGDGSCEVFWFIAKSI